MHARLAAHPAYDLEGKKQGRAGGGECVADEKEYGFGCVVVLRVCGRCQGAGEGKVVNACLCDGAPFAAIGVSYH